MYDGGSHIYDAVRSLCIHSVFSAYRYTGKERDTESGNDYFGARYYASTMGRFLSPDWSAKVEPVPYAKLDNPQSLNLYAYVANNPLIRVDADGHRIFFRGDEEARKKELQRATETLSSAEKGLFYVKGGRHGTFQLKLDKHAAAQFEGEHTQKFGMLVEAINNKHSIGVNMVTNDQNVSIMGNTRNIETDLGGGITRYLRNSQGGFNGNSEVYLSEGKDLEFTTGNNGLLITTTTGLKFDHEVLGHARLAAEGLPHREPAAVGVENQIRQENMMDQRPVPQQ